MTIRHARTIAGCFAAVAVAASLAACKNKSDPTPVNESGYGPTKAPTEDPATPADPAAPTPPTPTVANPEPAPHELPKETDPVEVEGWRPSWWLEDPMKTQQHAVACAHATDGELSKARASAVDAARQKLKQFLGREPGATEMKTDALRTPDGQYRAFVLIQTPLK